MRKAIAILPVVSAIYPMITGAIAPPTIVMISNEEASLVLVPASLNASEKIVGNMMLSPRYRAKNAMRDMNLALSLKQRMGLMGRMGAKFFEPPSSSSQGGRHISHQASLLPEERGCNRPPVLRTATL